MIIIRNYILFNEKIKDNTVNWKDLVENQKNIRIKLGLDNPNTYEESLNIGLKIIDSLNNQTLFVYDPEFEFYSVLTGQKISNHSTEKGVFSYFKGEGREWVNCYCDFDKGEILMKLSVCGHVFHADCAEEYMYYSNQCPLCRSDIYQI